MDIALDPIQIRVLGALVEKQLATPDQYPLSLAALSAACNQKTSRDPVMRLGEHAVRAALDVLVARGLAREQSGYGSRVAKFAHRLGDSLGLAFDFDRADLALLATLMLRGPQTPGELRSRSSRMHEFDSVAAVEEALHRLESSERGPWVRALAREPGRRERRYMQLFGDTAEAAAAAAAPEPDHTAAPDAAAGDRVATLEREVAELRERLDRVERALAGDPVDSDR